MCNACLHFFAFRTFRISDPFWTSDFEEGGAAELGGGADDSVLTNPEQVDVPGGGSVSLSASC